MFDRLSFVNELIDAQFALELGHQSLFRQVWSDNSLLLVLVALQVLKLVAQLIGEESLLLLWVILTTCPKLSFALEIAEVWLLVIVGASVEQQIELFHRVFLRFNVFVDPLS